MARKSLSRRLMLQTLEDRWQPAKITPPVVTGPTANDDSADTDGNNPVVVAVLANDAAVADQTLDTASVHVLTGPFHGRVVFDTKTGDVTYTSIGFYQGTDTFYYNVKDSSGAVSNTAKVSVIINRPVANDDFAEAVGTTPIDINVLENDTDPDGNGEIDTGSVKIVGSPSHGIVNIDSVTGVATYQMNSTFVGTDHFSYTITDKAGAESAPGIVTVTIKPNSSGPITPEALDDVVDTDGTNPVSIDIAANDIAPAGSTINRDFATIVTQPKHGKLTQEFTSLPPINGAVGNVAILTGNYIYTAEAGFRGTDTFTYTITDSQARVSNVATVSVIVNLPVANDDFTETSGSSPVLIDVLANDTDRTGMTRSTRPP